MRYVANKKLEAKRADQLSLTWINDILRHNLSSVNALLTTRSPGALEVLRVSWFRPSRPLGAQSVWPRQKISENPKGNIKVRGQKYCQLYLNQVDHVLRNTVRVEVAGFLWCGGGAGAGIAYSISWIRFGNNWGVHIDMVPFFMRWYNLWRHRDYSL